MWYEQIYDTPPLNDVGKCILKHEPRFQVFLSSFKESNVSARFVNKTLLIPFKFTTRKLSRVKPR